MHVTLHSILALLTLTYAVPSPQVSDIPSLISGLVGNTQPPSETDIHSPRCSDVNQGTLMCCTLQINGGNTIVQALANLAHYNLTKDSINGLDCESFVAWSECEEKTEGR